MALILADRVKESTTTTGTSDFALGGAITGFQTFAAGVGVSNTTYYAVSQGSDWEVGLGTLSSDGLTLARTTVLQSSNSDTKVSFAAGSKEVFVTYPADKAVLSDSTQTLTNKTLTSPKINEILDTNGNEILGLSATASATDFVTVKNGIGTGVPLHIYADGPSANIGLHLQPKGTGLITISDGTDFNKGIRFRSSSSAASAVTLLDAVSTAGRVVTLPDATTTLVGRDTTDTLTNKTINLTSNTLVATSAQLASAVTDETGTGALVFANSPSLVTPALGTPSSATLTNATGLPISTGVSGLGTDVATALAVNVGTAGAPVVNGGVLGTPSSGTATNLTGLPLSTGVTGTLPIANGGTGETTRQAALDALAGAVTSGSYLRGNGTDVVMSTIQVTDVPTLNQNTTGTASNVTGTVAVVNGGTGQTTYTDGQLLIGNTTGNTLTKATLTQGTGISITNGNGSITIASTGGGSVTSVTGTSPVASSGGATPAISLSTAYGDTLNPYASKTANFVLAAPNGTAGVPTFRAVVASDIPTLNQNTTGTAANVTGTVAVTNGGTGQTTYTNGQLLIGNTTGNTLTKATLTQGTGITITNGAGAITIASSATGTVTSVAATVPSLLSVSGSPITTSGTLAISYSGTALPAANGGTGQTSYAIGDILYASTSSALSKLADVATGNALISGGVGVAPSYGKIGLTTHVSGTLPVANGGTGTTSTTFANLTTNVTGTLPIANGGTNSTATPTANGVIYGTGTAYAVTAAGTTGQILTATTGSAPTWTTPASGGGSWIYITTVTGSAASTIDVDSTYTGYDVFVIVGTGIKCSAASSQLRCTFKLGGTYVTSSYNMAASYVSSGSSATTSLSQSSQSYITLGSSAASFVAQDSTNLVLYTYNPTSTSLRKMIDWKLTALVNSGQSEFVTGSGRNSANTSALTGIRIEYSSGTITGTFYLYGIKNS